MYTEFMGCIFKSLRKFYILCNDDNYHEIRENLNPLKLTTYHI